MSIPELMDRLAPKDGDNPTRMTGVKIYRASQFQPRQPLCYGQSAIIVGQGTKTVFLGGKSYVYNPENYLVLSVPLPAECEAMATPESPLLALVLDLDVSLIRKLLGRIPDSPKGRETQGLFLSKATEAFKDTVHRLLRALDSPLEAPVIGPLALEELMFRFICSENGAALAALAGKDTKISRVDRALKQIHSSYDRPMDVDELAGLVHMSPSSFHRAFKEVTASSPIQYLKKIRLDKARSLLAEQGLRVGEAAVRVGYESPNQFSREFKRYFGASPVSFTGSRPAS